MQNFIEMSCNFYSKPKKIYAQLLHDAQFLCKKIWLETLKVTYPRNFSLLLNVTINFSNLQNVNQKFFGLRNGNWNFSRFHSINQKIFGLHSVSHKHSGFHLIQNNNRIPLKGTNFSIIPFPYGIFVGNNGNH